MSLALSEALPDYDCPCPHCWRRLATGLHETGSWFFSVKTKFPSLFKNWHVMVLGTRDLGNVTKYHHRTPIPGTYQALLLTWAPHTQLGTLSESWLSFLTAITFNSFFFFFFASDIGWVLRWEMRGKEQCQNNKGYSKNAGRQKLWFVKPQQLDWWGAAFAVLKVALQNVLTDRDTEPVTLPGRERCLLYAHLGFLLLGAEPGDWETGGKWETAEAPFICLCFPSFFQPLWEAGTPSCKFWPLILQLYSQVLGQTLSLPALHGITALLPGPGD